MRDRANERQSALGAGPRRAFEGDIILLDIGERQRDVWDVPETRRELIAFAPVVRIARDIWRGRQSIHHSGAAKPTERC
jgi:hypothetical protein